MKIEMKFISVATFISFKEELLNNSSRIELRCEKSKNCEISKIYLNL